MRTLKRLFWILVLLAVVAAIGLHGFVRSTPGKAAIAKRISQATGLKATVGEARLSGCALALSDVKVWFAETDGAERVVLAAPEVVVSRLDGRRKIVLARPEINGFQSALSDWTPAAIRGFADPAGLETALAEFARSAQVWFEIKEARIVLQDASGQDVASYSGVDWSHLPARLAGRLAMTHDRVVAQAIGGRSAAFLKEWLDDGRLSVVLETSKSPEAAPAAVVAESPASVAAPPAAVPEPPAEPAAAEAVELKDQAPAAGPAKEAPAEGGSAAEEERKAE